MSPACSLLLRACLVLAWRKAAGYGAWRLAVADPHVLVLLEAAPAQPQGRGVRREHLRRCWTASHLRHNATCSLVRNLSYLGPIFVRISSTLDRYAVHYMN